MISPSVISIHAHKVKSILKWSENQLPVPHSILFFLTNGKETAIIQSLENVLRASLKVDHLSSYRMLRHRLAYFS